MLNLKQYPEPSIDAYTIALRRKQNEDLKTRLEAIENMIHDCYEIFENAQLTNTLESIIPNQKLSPYKEDLNCLYSYKSKAIKDIKKAINEAQIHNIITTCQNCTINSVNSFDHILGQSDFPEFSVNPLNLFPSCTECNGYKNDTFIVNNQRKFLNLYLDPLPSEQYLFVEIDNTDRGFDFCYYIDNKNNIDPSLFAIISNHYKYLHLLQRMKDKASEGYVSELEATIKEYKDISTLENVISKAIQNANKNLLVYGYNHYKYVLELALLTNPIFLSRLN